MKEKTTEGRNTSRVAWESLENWARLEIQEWIQELMVAEVTEVSRPPEIGATNTMDHPGVTVTTGYGE